VWRIGRVNRGHRGNLKSPISSRQTMTKTCDECGRDAPLDYDFGWYDVAWRHHVEDDEETVLCSEECLKAYWL